MIEPDAEEQEWIKIFEEMKEEDIIICLKCGERESFKHLWNAHTTYVAPMDNYGHIDFKEKEIDDSTDANDDYGQNLCDNCGEEVDTMDEESIPEIISHIDDGCVWSEDELDIEDQNKILLQWLGAHAI